MGPPELLAAERVSCLLEQPAQLLPVDPTDETDRRRSRPDPLARRLTPTGVIVVQTAGDLALGVLPAARAERDEAHHRRPTRSGTAR